MNVDSRPFNILSLCTGGFGLDLAIELAVPGSRVVCGVEWEAFACAYLVACMEAGAVAAFPLWSNLKTFDGRPWRGTVDCLTAGYPCQPFSTAGLRRGSDDPRHLWPDVARVIAEAGPPIVFLENVANHLRLGGREVLSELRGMGYRVAAGLFTASEVGAPHLRKRLFILGVADAVREHDRIATAGGCGGARRPAARSGAKVADSNGAGLEQHAKRNSPAWPPGPADIDRWREILSADPTLEPAVCSLADGLARDRRHYLRLAGYGVCPLAAAHAFLSLWSDLEGG